MAIVRKRKSESGHSFGIEEIPRDVWRDFYSPAAIDRDIKECDERVAAHYAAIKARRAKEMSRPVRVIKANSPEATRIKTSKRRAK